MTIRDPVALTPREIRAALDDALALVEDPRELIGRYVPSAARIWAEEKRIAIRETEFAPPNRLYITGAIPVPGVFVP